MPPKTAEFTRTTAKQWMALHAAEHRDDCGEVNMTALAEDCASNFDVADVGGPLDDSNHWIWDLAFQANLAHSS